MSFRKKPDVEAIRKFKKLRQEEIRKLRLTISAVQAKKKRLARKKLEKKNIVSKVKLKCIKRL